MEIKAELKRPYTDDERVEFIVKQNHELGYEIREVETTYEVEIQVPYTEIETEEIQVPIFDEEGNPVLDDDGNQTFETKTIEKEVVKYRTETVEKTGYNLEAWGKTDDDYIKEREEQFNKDFFNTSLGYIRRKVSMATGETKDFLSDLLPTISMGVQMGQPVQIIAYDKPDFAQEITDWTVLQNVKTVTAEFVQECFLQLSNDFKPVEVQDENTTDTTESDIQDKLDATTSKSDETNTDILEQRK